ncbi:hypothetical protein WJX74_010418 [Apatococcus lobatus]|uniref:Exostosin GT47 domain-containing protein n=1 Tax=Apatococcus lobatus TaxID=904363 RepID=A0AAW1Q7N8_9CHLO
MVSKESEDAQKAYKEAKMEAHLGAKAAAAAEAAREGAARSGGEATGTGVNEVPRHQLDVPRTWKPPKRPGGRQYEDRPLVYIYDLPTPLVNCSREDWAAFNYGTEVRLPQVLRESHYATDDPVAADLFLVPALLYCNDLEHHLPPGQKPDQYQTAVLTTLDWIRYYYPFWDLYNGADHMWIFTQDHGFCGFTSGDGTMNEISNSIILSHWGLMDYEAGHCTTEERLHNECPLSTLHPCFDPTKDVVIPSPQSDWMQMQEVPVSHWFAAAKTHAATAVPQPEHEHVPAQPASELPAEAPHGQVTSLSQQGTKTRHERDEQIMTSLQFDSSVRSAAHEATAAADDVPADGEIQSRRPPEQGLNQASPVGINPAEPTLILEDLAFNAKPQALNSPAPSTMDAASHDMQAASGADKIDVDRVPAAQALSPSSAGSRRLQSFAATGSKLVGSQQLPAVHTLQESAHQTERAMPSSATESQRLERFHAMAASQAFASGRTLQDKELQATASNPKPEQPEYDFLSGVYERIPDAHDNAADEPETSGTAPAVRLDMLESEQEANWDESADDPPGLGPINLDAWLVSPDHPPGLGPVDLNDMVERLRLQARPTGSIDQPNAADQLRRHSKSNSIGGAALSHLDNDHRPHGVTVSKGQASSNLPHVEHSHVQRPAREQAYAHSTGADAREAAEVEPLWVSMDPSEATDPPGGSQSTASDSGSQVEAGLRMQQGLEAAVPLFGPARGARRPYGHQKQPLLPDDVATPGHRPSHEIATHGQKHDVGAAMQAEVASAAADYPLAPDADGAEALQPTDLQAQHVRLADATSSMQPDLVVASRPQVGDNPSQPSDEMAGRMRPQRSRARSVLAAQHTSQGSLSRHMPEPSARDSHVLYSKHHLGPATGPSTKQMALNRHVPKQSARASYSMNGWHRMGPASKPGGNHIIRTGHRLYEPAPAVLHERRLLMSEDAAPAWEPESFVDKMQSWLDENAEETQTPPLHSDSLRQPTGHAKDGTANAAVPRHYLSGGRSRSHPHAGKSIAGQGMPDILADPDQAAAGTFRRSHSSFADIAASAGHGSSDQQAVAMHGVATPMPVGHLNADKPAAPLHASVGQQDDADGITASHLAQFPAIMHPAGPAQKAKISGQHPHDSQEGQPPAATALGKQPGPDHARPPTTSQPTLGSMEDGGNSDDKLSRPGRHAHGPTAAEALQIFDAHDQLDEMAVSARAALDQLTNDEADVAQGPLPMETVFVVQRTDGFVTSDRRHDLGAEFQLLPLDPLGVLKSAQTFKPPDAKDVEIPPEVIEQAKVHPWLVKDNTRLSNPLPHMQMGTTNNGDDLETVAAAKRWLFQELHGWWADYDKIFNALHLQDDIFEPEKAPAIWTAPDQLALVPLHHSAPSRRLEETQDSIPKLQDPPVLAKTSIFYFVGGTGEKNVAYSHGVRQTIWALFHDRPGYRVISSDVDGRVEGDDYLRGFEESIFCLAATGDGWGVRLKLAVLFRCIPVIIADQIQMEYEDVLPYSEFSIRLPQHAIYRLPYVLQEIMDTPGKVQHMQHMMHCVWAFFSWKEKEGRALEALMCSLRRKLYGSHEAARPTIDPETCQLSCNVQM